MDWIGVISGALEGFLGLTVSFTGLGATTTLASSSYFILLHDNAYIWLFIKYERDLDIETKSVYLSLENRLIAVGDEHQKIA